MAIDNKKLRAVQFTYEAWDISRTTDENGVKHDKKEFLHMKKVGFFTDDEQDIQSIDENDIEYLKLLKEKFCECMDEGIEKLSILQMHAQGIEPYEIAKELNTDTGKVAYIIEKDKRDKIRQKEGYQYNERH